jgi:hypothetical protein
MDTFDRGWMNWFGRVKGMQFLDLFVLSMPCFIYLEFVAFEFWVKAINLQNNRLSPLAVSVSCTISKTGCMGFR